MTPAQQDRIQSWHRLDKTHQRLMAEWVITYPSLPITYKTAYEELYHSLSWRNFCTRLNELKRLKIIYRMPSDHKLHCVDRKQVAKLLEQGGWHNA